MFFSKISLRSDYENFEGILDDVFFNFSVVETANLLYILWSISQFFGWMYTLWMNNFSSIHIWHISFIYAYVNNWSTPIKEKNPFIDFLHCLQLLMEKEIPGVSKSSFIFLIGASATPLLREPSPRHRLLCVCIVCMTWTSIPTGTVRGRVGALAGN